MREQAAGSIGIVSLGEAQGDEEARVLQALGARFHLPGVVMSPQPLIEDYLDARRGQYDALGILGWLEALYPESPDRVLAIAQVDLCLPVLTFVFGEARLGGRVALVSTHRLREAFYGRPEDRDLLLSRLEKEAIHEVGHLLSLTHCLDRNCVMHASHGVMDTDVKSAFLCASCRAELPTWAR